VLYVNENLILVNSKEIVEQNRIVFDKIKDEIDLNKNNEPDVSIKIQLQYQLPYSLTREGLNSYTD
jgi:hypothetical protein